MRNRTAKRLTLEVRRGPTANAKVKSPLKLDPTRTLTIRRAFAAKLRAAYARLKGRLVKLVQDDDTYGLGAVRNAYNVSPPTDWDALNAETDQRMERAVWGDSGKGARDNVPRWGATPHDPHTAFPSGEVRNAALYAFASDPQKLAAFQAWLRGQLAQLVIGHTQEQLWDAYIQAGFKKGAGRAFDDVRQSELAKRRPDLFTRTSQDSVKDFYAGTKDEFLRSSFAQPVAKEKVELLASRSFDELEDVTSTMANRMSRVLTDGMVQGQSPRDVAKTLADEVDIGQERALTIARTEIIRAHAEGQLTALENLGVEEVGVAVEWSTADDELVCPLCESLEGVVLKLDEARGVLPRHPNCRCAWVPANVGEDDKDQKDTKGEIDDAFDGAGLNITVDKDRPESIVGNELDWRWWTLEGPRADVLDAFSVALNAFCPTGPGGGINPTCSPGGRHTAGAGDLYTGKGLADYLRNNLKAKMTPAMLDKITQIHPNGIQGGTFHVPASYVHTPSYGKQGVQDKIDDLFQVLPAGTIIKSKDYSKVKGTSAAATPAIPSTVPAAIPAASAGPPIPHLKEITWETGKAGNAVSGSGTPVAGEGAERCAFHTGTAEVLGAHEGRDYLQGATAAS
jgi:SPP1 gp7 family putative phage head morphogenesis protein